MKTAHNPANEVATDLTGIRAELKTVRDGFAREFAENCKLRSELEDMRLRAIHAEAVVVACEPFVRVVKTSSGRIPYERLSAAHWHSLCKAHAKATA